MKNIMDMNEEEYKQLQEWAKQEIERSKTAYSGYYEVARENEEIFRNVLNDLRDNKEKRPVGGIIPKDLETELELDDFFEKYSEGDRKGVFTITNFMINKDKAGIVYQDIAPLSGVGAELEYLVKKDNSVEYKGSKGVWMS